MTNEGFKLEELENAAVKKSNNAKRAAAIGATVAGSGAIGVAAKAIYDNHVTGDENADDSDLTTDDLDQVVNEGSQHVENAPNPAQNAAPAAPHHAPAPGPGQAPGPVPTPPEDEIDVEFDTTTHYYDENNDLIMTTQEGTVEGRDFLLADLDNDGKADIFAYDQNNDGVYQDNEITYLTGADQISMNNPTPHHEDVFLPPVEPEPIDPEPIDPEPLPEPPYYIDEDKDYDDTINNDFVDEKTGETYQDDYADNNDNYINDGDVDQYSASSESVAYEDDMDKGYDDSYEDLASNDTLDDGGDEIMNDDMIDLA